MGSAWTLPPWPPSVSLPITGLAPSRWGPSRLGVRSSRRPRRWREPAWDPHLDGARGRALGVRFLLVDENSGCVPTVNKIYNLEGPSSSPGKGRWRGARLVPIVNPDLEGVRWKGDGGRTWSTAVTGSGDVLKRTQQGEVVQGLGWIWSSRAFGLPWGFAGSTSYEVLGRTRSHILL